jgi:hypothetical protein
MLIARLLGNVGQSKLVDVTKVSRVFVASIFSVGPEASVEFNRRSKRKEFSALKKELVRQGIVIRIFVHLVYIYIHSVGILFDLRMYIF